MSREPDRRPNLAPLALLALLTLSAAGPPEIVRVRVPSARVPAWFPPGTDQLGMSSDEFEALARVALADHKLEARRQPPRLLRIRHEVRWRDGRLLGRSELLIEGTEAATAPLPLVPWTPAILHPPSSIRSGPDGRTSAWVGAGGPSTVILEWELRSRTGSDGRTFALGLPRLDAASTTLDLPAGWVPEGLAGVRQGPTPGSEPDRQAWRFDGPGGWADLTLRTKADAGASGISPASRAWVGGPTRVELDDAAARWRADWTVDPGPTGPRRLVVELDEGLEPIDATGPNVVSFRAEPSEVEGRTRLVVRISEEAVGPTPLTIEARAPAPSEGAWAIPAARPVDAHWIGGETTVRIGPARALEDCRPRAGLRVVPRAEGPQETPARAGLILAFEATGPESVAELVFARPEADATAEVRGWVALGDAAPRAEAMVTWKARRGRPPTLIADLAAGWAVDDVRMADGGAPLRWHSEPRKGGTRLTIQSPPFIEPAGTLALVVSATGVEGAGPLALPRLIPAGAAIADELWTALAAPGLAVRPVRASGLAWTDPSTLPPLPEGAPKLEAVLAWRWIALAGEAWADLDRDTSTPNATIDETAAVAAGRLRIEARFAVVADERRPRLLPVWFGGPMDAPLSWRIEAADDSIPLPARPLDDAEKAHRGLPVGGSAWEVDLASAPRGSVVVRADLERAWSGRGTIPLPALPARFHARGVVRVTVDPAMRSEVEAVGLRVLDPDLAGPPPPGLRAAHAFGLDGAGGHLVLKTEALSPSASGGLIREATLSTHLGADSVARQRLILRVEPAGATTLGVTLPGGARPEIALLDGKPTTPALRGEALILALPRPRPGHPSCTIVLDYPAPTGPAIRPEPPAFTMPCLALAWDVSRPGPWVAEALGPALVRADPEPSPSWPTRVVGAWPRWWPSLGSPASSSQAIADLDGLVAAESVGTSSLRDRFTRWDAGKRPLIIDRQALAAAGLGPGSIATKGAGRTAREVLEPLGLIAVPVGGMLLVTTKVEAPDLDAGPEVADAWARAIRAAASTGSDPSDRFQSASRWRNESDPIERQPGANTPPRRFAAPGWPTAGVTFVAADLRARVAWCWALGLCVLIVGLATRLAAPLARAAGLSMAWLAAMVVEAWAVPVASALAAGVAFGVLAVAAYWLGRSAKRRAARAVAALPSGVRSRSHLTRGGVALTLGILGMAGIVAAEVGGAADGPILVLIPFEGVLEPGAKATRVVLRLADHDRLRAWADAGKALPVGGIGATAATHSARPLGDGEAAVESRFELQSEGPGPWSWTIPIGGARDLSATLDAKATPIVVRPGGQAATVEIVGAGGHALVVRRVVDRARAEVGGPISVPINPVAAALVSIEAGARAVRAEVVGARGLIREEPPGLAGNLGPVERLEVRWAPAGQVPGAVVASGPVEGVLLWDATPAGDRLRARLTFLNPTGTSAVRLAMEPGLAVRSATAPGLIESRWEGTAEGPEWVARFEPPLGADESLVLDCWRPNVGGHPDARRRLPRLAPVGVGGYSGLLGFRRPGEWSGRMGPIAGAEAVADEAFVKAWGDLPRDHLTLAGSLRFATPAAIEVGADPTPPRPSIKQAVDLTITPGRLEVRVAATLTGRGGPCFEALARVPEGLQLTRVEADGLTHWSRPRPGLLRLRFDGPDVAKRAIHLEGWLAAESDPMAAGPVALEAPIPWPLWEDVEDEPGTLAVASPVACRVEEASGLAKVEPAAPTAALPTRLAFRVERAETPGLLRWSCPPPKVAVSVRSLLTIDPGAASWAALVDYRVSGGSADAIRLKLPASWSRSATVRVEGEESQASTREEGGAIVWTIRPGRRAWGALRVVVRATRPVARGESLEFPDLVPLGQGTVETLLALSDRSGWGVVPGGSPGLQPVAAARFRVGDFGEAPAPTAPDVYLVRREGWSLRVRMGESPESDPTLGEGSRAARADLTCVVGADGEASGEARYEVGPRPGPTLEIHLPDGSEALGATVEGRPVAPLRWTGGRWLIPLGGGLRARTVSLTWHSAPGSRGAGGRRTIALPELTGPQAPTTLTIYAPEAATVEAPGDPWRAVPGDTQAVERLEGSGRRIAEGLAEVDRGSSPGRRAMVASLMEFELSARGVERAVAWGPIDRSPGVAEAHRRVLARLREARTALSEALATAGLEDLAAEAQAGVGLSSTPSPPTVPTSPGQLRRLGRPRYFRADSPTVGGSSPRFLPSEAPAPWRRAEFWALIAAGLVAIPMAIGLAWRGVRPARLALAAPSVALAAWALGVEPSSLAVLLLAAGLGWTTYRPASSRADAHADLGR